MVKTVRRILLSLFVFLWIMSSGQMQAEASQMNGDIINPGIENVQVGPQLDIESIQVSAEEVEAGEQVQISFTVEGETPVADAYCNIVYANGERPGCMLEWDETRENWTFTYEALYAGQAEIVDIYLIDAEGNCVRYINTSRSGYTDDSDIIGDEEKVYCDLSAGNFNVLGDENDTEAPILDVESLTVSSKNIELNQNAEVSFIIEDDSYISMVDCDITYGNGEGAGCGLNCDRETGKWTFSFDATYAGKAEIKKIVAKDANGNTAYYINTAHSAYDEDMDVPEDGVVSYVDLSAGSFNIIAGEYEENAPIIDFDTIEVSSSYVEFSDYVSISFKVTDETGFSYVGCSISYGNGAGAGCLVDYDEETGIWTFTYDARYYGLAEIQSVYAEDVFGNKVEYYNSGHSRFGEDGFYWGEEGVSNYRDFSEHVFYVGLKDDSTGIFVSGDGLSDDSELTVEEKEFKGDDYDKMHGKDHGKKGHKSKGFYNIHVDKYDKHKKKYHVFFDVPWAKEGEKIRVCHKLSDGTLQEEELIAKNGKIEMWVTEFSPFLVEQIVEVEETGEWKKDSVGWWYQNSDGTYPVNCWKKINGEWYAFDKKGYMREGWFRDGSTWYYLNYVDGNMATGWIKDSGKWYYLKDSGAMATGWIKDGDKWYYLKNSGAMATGWIKDGGKWYYLKNSGAMATGWIKDGNTWYYLKDSGAMATGWIKDGNTWDYLKNSGAMAIGWIKDGNTWYYLNSSGAMASNTWIGGYYVDSSGAWVQ